MPNWILQIKMLTVLSYCKIQLGILWRIVYIMLSNNEMLMYLLNKYSPRMTILLCGPATSLCLQMCSTWFQDAFWLLKDSKTSPLEDDYELNSRCFFELHLTASYDPWYQPNFLNGCPVLHFHYIHLDDTDTQLPKRKRFKQSFSSSLFYPH